MMGVITQGTKSDPLQILHSLEKENILQLTCLNEFIAKYW